MTKRSLAEQLDAAVQELLENPHARQPQKDERLAPLTRLAAELRSLPRPAFKNRLRSELRRRKSMATLAEPKPGVRTVAAPTLTFKDTAKAIDFYTKALGARETMRFETHGTIPHAEIMIGDSLIVLTDEWPEGGRFSAETLGQSPVSISLEVENMDAFAERAVAAGMKTLSAPRDQFYGRRDGIFLDPFGYTWRILTVTEPMSVEEMHRRMDATHEASAKPAVEPVPKRFRTVTPYLVAQDGPALLEFAKQAFGAEELFRGIGSAGGIHAEMRIGDSMLMMGGGIPGREFRFTPNTHALHVYVKDCDAVYQKALGAEATSLGEPRDQEYGERSASVKDLAGNYWYIATYKGKTYVPKGLHDVNPYLHPLRVEPVIQFLKRAFGAREMSKHASPDGVIHHAEIRVGSSVVEMGEAHGQYQPMQPMFYVYVPNVDHVYNAALAAGASSLLEPSDKPYGDRSGAVKDTFGNQWHIATHIKDV
jgi:PhnB protein